MKKLIEFIDNMSGNWYGMMFIGLSGVSLVYLPFYFMFGWIGGLLYTYAILFLFIVLTPIIHEIRIEHQKRKERQRVQNVENVDIVTDESEELIPIAELSEEKQCELELLFEVYSHNRQLINLFVEVNHVDEDEVWEKAKERFEDDMTYAPNE